MDDLISRQQIAQLTEAYCRDIDRADETSLRSLFHVDSMVMSGPFNQDGYAFAATICRTMKAVFNRTYHAITAQDLYVDEDDALGETHVAMIATMQTEGGAPIEILATGVFRDRFQRREGVWKFSERIFLSERVEHESNVDDDPGFDIPKSPNRPCAYAQDQNDHIFQIWQ
ncbi:MAG: nuclear transport factor 2 family protein [Sphingobium sp.]